VSPPPDDERRRLEKTYRELDAQELLRLFDGRQTLPADAVEALRIELRLRGLDPDSLRATVPKAVSTDDDASDVAPGDATLVDADAAPDEPSKVGAPPAAPPEAEGEGEGEAAPEPSPEAAAAEAAASAATVRCTQCGARNPTIEDLCLRCGAPLGEAPQHQTMSRRIADSPSAAAPRPSGTAASATTGVIGISALVFSSYSLTLERPALLVTLVAALAGIASVGAAVVLYRAEKRRKEAEAAAAK
jgi:hypothetical protein